MWIAHLLWLSLALSVSGGSAARADIPKTPTESPYVAPEGEALLVFIRDRKRLASEVIYSVVNERGRCIASVPDSWKVVAPIKPGTQTLMIVTGVAQPQVQLLKVKAQAGKTYVVKMRPRVNTKSPVALTILRRSTEPLEVFPATILDTSPFKPDLEGCTAWVAARQSRLATKAAQVQQAWKAAEEEFRASQTVRPADGWTADEVTGP